ncbi:tRNA lysidine(34) synthetase TilS [Aquibaculum arenosum]|uniref:tRNA(Ile)-lysidine synthase n=1 Tax=Aquibaculum arenosum TaxID=3032591 RepID=A0ABT5YIM2_9PROT|nr:tRNA lysidine(34) synthetase TilS [Fodinicurvata sp. CAU 1616]MDF2094724.1 tRNA lysidine(34) synthetase TilS [Fodinicurvata sp. CAU 1616]
MSGWAADVAAPEPLNDAAFAALMAPLEPFEPEPLIACAVSGGADSLALLYLASRWAKARSGRVIALTVDHGLRPEAAAEARQVAAYAAALGAGHRTLLWRDPPQSGPVQAAARRARLTLMQQACREAGCLHLLLAHHRDDQIETLLLRLAKGSDLDGLAGMAPQRRGAGLRLLRPLLTVDKESLKATLRDAGLAWCEDPSNDDLRHERVRMRRLVPATTVAPERWQAAAETFARLRGWADARCAAWMGEYLALHPGGCASLPVEDFEALPHPLALRVLRHVVQAVGGRPYPPRSAVLRRALGRLRERPKGLTLAGCRLIRRPAQWLVVREAAGVESLKLAPGETCVWDRRYQIQLDQAAGAGCDPEAFYLGALGAANRSGLQPPAGEAWCEAVPGAARAALPALRYLEAVVAVPHLNLYQPGFSPGFLRISACPPQAAARSDFTLSGRVGILQAAGFGCS